MREHLICDANNLCVWYSFSAFWFFFWMHIAHVLVRCLLLWSNTHPKQLWEEKGLFYLTTYSSSWREAGQELKWNLKVGSLATVLCAPSPPSRKLALSQGSTEGTVRNHCLLAAPRHMLGLFPYKAHIPRPTAAPAGWPLLHQLAVKKMAHSQTHRQIWQRQILNVKIPSS